MNETFNNVRKTADMLRLTFIDQNISPNEALKGMSALIVDLFNSHSDEKSYKEWLEDMAEVWKELKKKKVRKK